MKFNHDFALLVKNWLFRKNNRRAKQCVVGSFHVTVDRTRYLKLKEAQRIGVRRRRVGRVKAIQWRRSLHKDNTLVTR